MSGLTGFRESFQFVDGASASDGPNLTNAITAAKYTAPFGITPFLKSRVLGAWFEFNATLTATAAESPVTGSDLLDLFLGGGGQIIVSAETNGPIQSQVINRATAEFNWAVCTDVNPNVGSNPTFASAGAANVTAYLFLPLGQNASSVKFLMPGSIANAYAANVTVAYTSIYSYVISTDWTGTVVYNEQETASLGTKSVDMTPYVPKTVKPDAIFLKGESSTTITAATLITVNNAVLTQTSATNIGQFAAAAIANVAGPTYTTDNGFVLYGNGYAYKTFQLTFSTATTHYISYLEVSGGEPTATQGSGSPTPAEPATSMQGQVTPSGEVRSGAGGGGASAATAALLRSKGSTGGIISRRA